MNQIIDICDKIIELHNKFDESIKANNGSRVIDSKLCIEYSNSCVDHAAKLARALKKSIDALKNISISVEMSGELGASRFSQTPEAKLAEMYLEEIEDIFK